MITIQPEAKSQLKCVRCGHSEDDHNWATGPCNQKDLVGYAGEIVACICYAFISPLDARLANFEDKTEGFILLHAAGKI